MSTDNSKKNTQNTINNNAQTKEQRPPLPKQDITSRVHEIFEIISDKKD